MIDPECRNCLEKCLCCCVRPAAKGKELIDDGKFVITPIRVGGGMSGGSILFCGKRKSHFPFQLFVGPDWPAVLLVYALIIGIDVGVLRLISSIGYPVIIIGGVGCTLLLCAYTATACSDPGIIYKDDCEMEEEKSGLQLGSVTNRNVNNVNESVTVGLVSNENELEEGRRSNSSGGSSGDRVSPSDNLVTSLTNMSIPKPATMPCGNCDIQRPVTARHCIYCGVCVDGLDHHCPWSGKCIGKNNMVAFQCFVTILCCQIYFLLGAFIYYCISVYQSDTPVGPKA